MKRDAGFSDGEIKEYSVNVIGENMFAQENDDGHNVQILRIIVDHRKDINAVDKSNMLLRVKSG